MTKQDEGAPSGAPGVIEESHCDLAQELLDALRPGLVSWSEGAWVFRGQEQDWPLLPSAHRYDRWRPYLTLFDQLKKATRPDVPAGCVLDEKAEETLVRRFRDVIDDAGLLVPQHNLLFEAFDGRTSLGRLWPPELQPLVALAQHHGIPTRLLDWSRRSRVAAYFAARQALESHQFQKYPSSPEKPMVVWALRTDVIAKQGGLYSANIGALDLVTAPRASNPNLHAQAGVFTLLQQLTEIRTLDEFLVAWASTSEIAHDYFPLMRKFNIPRKEARRVLVRLAHEGVTAAALFPGYEGAAREVREQALRGRGIQDGDE